MADTKEQNEALNRTKENSSESSSNGGSIGYDASAGTVVYSANDDILKGQAYKMYDNTQHLVGTQEQYQPRAGSRKIVNFRQDYVVLIRKKLFYAANASNQQIGKAEENNTDGTLKSQDDTSITSKGNYMRTYKIDNFTNLSISHSILSSGTCSVTMKGNERVMCYEHSLTNDKANPSIDDLIADMEHGGIHSSYTMDYESSSIKNATANINAQQNANQKKKREIEGWKDKNGNMVGDRTITTIGGATQVERTDIKDYYQESYTNVKIVGENRQDALELERPYSYKIKPDDIETPKSEWKIAEKCDFEAMDEVWVFGKSNFERDSSGEFKMNQIFFGYINDVKKTHASGGTNGCVISISAKDQLKLLELSYVSTQPSMIAGTTMSGSPGIDLRWGRQDPKHFGTVEIYNPYEVMAIMGEKGADASSEEQQMALQSLWKSFALKDIFGGLALEKIIRQMCLDAGIPPWYLTERIEPIQFPPFTVNIKQSSSDQVFSAATESRLRVCRRAVQDLLLEFFADEEGNIVMKCPNYALGANTKVKNNMGYSQLKGGLLNSESLGLYNMTNEYWAIQQEDITKKAIEKEGSDEELKNKGYMKKPGTDENSKPNEKNGEIKGNDGVYIRDPSVEERKVFTKEYKEYKDARDGYKIAEYCHFDINAAQYLASGSDITDSVANRLMRGTVGVEIKDGMTLYDVAEAYTGDGNNWQEIYDSNRELFDSMNASPQELSKLKGKVISVSTHKSEDLDKNDYAAKLQSEVDLRYKQWQAAGGQIYESEFVSDGSISKSKFESVKHKWYDHTLSELTDELIPEIPQEYIMGFTLTDSDENLFNMYEVNITGDFSPFDSSGPQTQIRRVFPDLNSMIRFGCRPNPKVFNFPHMGNKNNAHLLAYMLCAKSVAERYSATLNMIEDSSIKIGNPIRFFAYDEHPHKPLGSQEQGSYVSSALSDMSNSKKQITLQDASNAISSSVMNTFSNEISNSLQNISGGNTQTSMNLGGGGNQLNKILTEDGDDVNITVGKVAGSGYKGVGASWLAQQTDAQSIYYVSAIRRDIQMGAKESTMTLTLTHGRMLGKPSVIDQMMLLYKTYYDTNTGYCPDLSEIMAIRDKYVGNTQTYVIKAGDTLTSIAKDIYGLEIAQPQLKKIEGKDGQNEEDLRADQYSTFRLSDEGKDATKLDFKPFQNGWKRRTYESHGEYYKVSQGGTGSASKVSDYTIYVYDFDKTKFVYVGLKEDAKSQYTEQEPYVSSNSGTESYAEFVKRVAQGIHRDANK